MLKGFKEFVMRGNLVELAVAFVLAVAFGTVIASLVGNIIMPLIGKAGGQPNFDSITVADLPVGAFVTDLVAFVIIAAAVYFLVVMPYNKFNERYKKTEEAVEETPEDLVVLREIRDLLNRSAGESTGGGDHAL